MSRKIQTKYIGLGSIFIISVLFGVLIRDLYLIHIATIFFINIILALSLWLVFRTGELNLSICAFMAIGAYSSALFAMRLDLPFWATIFMAAVICGVISLLVGIPALRLKGPYFFIVTLAFAEIVIIILSSFWVDVLGSQTGIIGVPPPDAIPLPGFKVEFTSKLSNYYLGLIIMIISVLFFYALSNSRFGRISKAIAQADILVETVGINVKRHKLIAFIVASVFAGMAGSFHAHFIRIVTPWDYGVEYMVLITASMIVGGVGNMVGPIIGTFLFTILGVVLGDLSYLEVLITGIILVLCMRLLPRGLISLPAVIQHLRHKDDQIAK